MSTNQLLPVWLVQNVSMAADIASAAITLKFEDNPDIQCIWTGTPTGTIAIQVSLDPDELGWQTIPFAPAPSQPAGGAGGDYFSINQTSAAFIRLIYTRVSGTGTLKAKIAAKSV